jgi:hypothetical protein
VQPTGRQRIRRNYSIVDKEQGMYREDERKTDTGGIFFTQTPLFLPPLPRHQQRPDNAENTSARLVLASLS